MITNTPQTIQGRILRISYPVRTIKTLVFKASLHPCYIFCCSSYCSSNWVFYNTRKSNGSFGILSSMINSPSEVLNHCVIAGVCCGNNDDVHKNSVRDVASEAQGFLQSMRSCYQTSLINRD